MGFIEPVLFKKMFVGVLVPTGDMDGNIPFAILERVAQQFLFDAFVPMVTVHHKEHQEIFWDIISHSGFVHYGQAQDLILFLHGEHVAPKSGDVLCTILDGFPYGLLCGLFSLLVLEQKIGEPIGFHSGEPGKGVVGFDGHGFVLDDDVFLFFRLMDTIGNGDAILGTICPKQCTVELPS